jgi:hypothetical protein
VKAEVLRTIERVVVHDHCADGLAAALVLKHALPDVEIVFVEYNSEEHKQMTLGVDGAPRTLFCDVVPYVEREREPPHAMTEAGRSWARAWVERGTVVLDHHEGSEDLVRMFGNHGVFGRDDLAESGAMLAYTEVWNSLCGGGLVSIAVADFVRLAGLRDTWKRCDPQWREARRNATLLMFLPREQLLANGLATAIADLEHYEDVGEMLVARQDVEDRRAAAEAYRFDAPGPLRVACFQGDGRLASDAADLLADEGVELSLAWRYRCDSVRGALMKVSARSRGSFACDAFARRFGGNGHPNAAGFVLPVSVGGGSSNPYTALHGAVLSHVHDVRG